MPYPPEALRDDFLNETDAETGVDDAAGLEAEGGTPGEGEHAAHHNKLADGLEDVVDELGENPSGESATVQARLEALGLTLAGKADSSAVTTALAAKASKEELTAAIAKVIGGAPEALDTLKEVYDTLQAAEESDDAALSALSALVEGKLAKASNLSDLTNAGTARTNLGLGSAATHAHTDYQPSDEDLTLIAALSTTSFGRELLTKANEQALRELLSVRKEQVGVQIETKTVKNSTEFVTIPGMGFELGASATEVWRVTWWLKMQCSSTEGDAKFALTAGPAGASAVWGQISSGNNAAGKGWQTGPANNTPAKLLGLGESFNTQPTGNNTSGVPITALIYGGGTAGTINVQFCQNEAKEFNLSILEGSVMEAVRIRA